MRLPNLSAGVSRTTQTPDFATQGAIRPSAKACDMPCMPGKVCPTNCYCDCDDTYTKHPKGHYAIAGIIGCVCKSKRL